MMTSYIKHYMWCLMKKKTQKITTLTYFDPVFWQQMCMPCGHQETSALSSESIIKPTKANSLQVEQSESITLSSDTAP